MLINNKKAFSLIEIVQTVVLLGIIAGLSVSFFKKIDNDTKIKDATELEIYKAVQEANAQMCSDETPYCTGYDIATGNTYAYIVTDANNNCATAYNADGVNYNIAANYDKFTGYCYKNYNNNDCTQGMFLSQNREGKQVCYGVPKCYASANATPLQTDAADATQPVARPLYEITCPSNVPQWNAAIHRNIDGNPSNPINDTAIPEANEICYRLWNILNHNKKGNSDYEDLNVVCNSIGSGRFTNPCQVANNRNCSNQGNDRLTPSMTLPNGAMIFNMSCIGRGGCNYTDNVTPINDAQNIYIKTDRNQSLNSYTPDTVYVLNLFDISGNTDILNVVNASLGIGNEINSKNGNADDNTYKYSKFIEKKINTTNSGSEEGESGNGGGN